MFAEGIEGNVRILVDEDTQITVGAKFVRPGPVKVLQVATISTTRRFTLDDLWHATPAFPTISEFWLRLLEAY